MNVSDLRRLQLDSLSDADKDELKAWCTLTLSHFEDAEKESKESKEPADKESKDKSETAGAHQPDASQQDAPTYIFNMGADAAWPKPTGQSNREKAIASRREG